MPLFRKMAICMPLEKVTMFGRQPDVACRWQITTPAVSLDLNVGVGLQ